MEFGGQTLLLCLDMVRRAGQGQELGNAQPVKRGRVNSEKVRGVRRR